MKKELSKREKEVLKLISEGDTSAVIGGKLGISRSTVDAHTSNMLKKTGAKNSSHLVMMCIERGSLLMQRCSTVRYVPESDIEGCVNGLSRIVDIVKEGIEPVNN